VESLFIAFRLTGDVRYRNYGWEIFQAIEKYCRIETGGYASILNVDDVGSKLEDKMETFLMVGPLIFSSFYAWLLLMLFTCTSLERNPEVSISAIL
jgi:hypothetical protein